MRRSYRGDAESPTATWSRRSVLATAGAVAATATGALAGAEPAAAGPRPATLVRLTVTAAGFATPDPVPAGPVTFEVRTDNARLQSVGLIRLNPGVSLADFVSHLVASNSTDPAVRAAAVPELDASAVPLGGAGASAVSPIRFTTVLQPGRYYLVNYSEIARTDFADRIRPLDVTFPVHFGSLPPVDGLIREYDRDGRTLIAAPPVLPARGTVLVSNETAQLNELLFFKVAEDTTAEQVTAFFDALRDKTPIPPSPLLSQPEGMAPLGSQRFGLLGIDLPPARYLVTSFISNRRNLVANAYQGTWALLTLRAR